MVLCGLVPVIPTASFQTTAPFALGHINLSVHLIPSCHRTFAQAFPSAWNFFTSSSRSSLVLLTKSNPPIGSTLQHHLLLPFACHS